MQRHEPELPGMGRMRRRPRRPAARTMRRTARRSGRCASASDRPGPPPGRRTSTNASTATGDPSAATISGLTSMLSTSSRSAINRPIPISVRARTSRSTASSPRNGPSSLAVTRSPIISAAVTSSSGAGRNTTSAIASARTPPTPSMTVGPNCGSRSAPTMNSRLPFTIPATSTFTVPSSGVAAASSSAAAAATSAGLRRSRRTRRRSVLWAIASPLSLATTGYPISSAAATAPAASSANLSTAVGTPYEAKSSFDARSDSVLLMRRSP